MATQELRAEALRRARNMRKSLGSPRRENINGKKCVCVMGLMGEVLGYKIKPFGGMSVSQQKDVFKKFQVGDDYWEVVLLNDREMRDESLYQVTRELFKRFPLAS